MADIIGDLLPLALAIALSPIPIIATVLTLLSPRAPLTSLGYLLGSLVGIMAAVSLFVLLSGLLPESESDETKPIVGTIKILLGIVLMYLAVRKWQGRPAEGESAPLPGWMTSIDRLSPTRAIWMGGVVAIANPKNIILSASAGVTIGPAGLSTPATILASAVFTVLATISVWLPVAVYLAAPQRFSTSLEDLRRWLVQNNQALMAAVLLIIGAAVTGQGVGDF